MKGGFWFRGCVSKEEKKQKIPTSCSKMMLAVRSQAETMQKDTTNLMKSNLTCFVIIEKQWNNTFIIQNSTNKQQTHNHTQTNDAEIWLFEANIEKQNQRRTTLTMRKENFFTLPHNSTLRQFRQQQRRYYYQKSFSFAAQQSNSMSLFIVIVTVFIIMPSSSWL